MTYQMQLECMIQHIICTAPACVVLEDEFKGWRDLAFGLQLFEVFDPLAGDLNLKRI